jgi:hypothetical protein
MRLVVVALIGVAATPVHAGPWALDDGRSQVILKYEDMRASDGFDGTGDRISLAGARIDRSLGMLAEYGVTDQITLQFKGDWQSGEDAAFDYEGRGPIEIGATVQVWRTDRSAVSIYGGYADGGDGRNAGYAAPGVGQRDWELRTSVGHTFNGGGRWGPTRSFLDVQIARRMREGLPDEARADLTFGAHYGDNWLLLGQAFGGVSEGDTARWLSIETSVVRHLGSWSLQGGWRQSVAGRQTPVASGPVLALWRRF